MIAGIVVYFINFVSGKTRNQKLANAWLSAHKNLLESNFSLVGTYVGEFIESFEAVFFFNTFISQNQHSQNKKQVGSERGGTSRQRRAECC